MTRELGANTVNPLIPFFGSIVPAGFPSPAMDYIEERIDLTAQLAPHPLSTFYCFCEGDSMLDACIPPKAILVVDKSLTAKTGDIVVAYLQGGFTVKYIRFEDKKCYLVPANRKKKYPVIEVTEEMEMIVWGVVTNVVIDTKNIRLCTL
ncbi:MAG: translesion error-prone DNA polymerase V autoproteolytic subunit [Bacteroidota bacterium]